MRSYAVLGATGNTGLSLLNILSKSPTAHVKAYCRSKAKLERLAPDIAAGPNCTVYEGSLTDDAVISACIKDTHAVFLAVAVPGNVPGCSVAQDTAHAAVAALERLRTERPSRPLPRLIVLSAAAIDFDLTAHFGHRVLYTALSHLYDDLKAAEKYLREHDWISTAFVKPGMLSNDVQKGHAVSLNGSESVLSFLDLATGMVEIADAEDERYRGANVAVVPTGGPARFPPENLLEIAKGLLVHFAPSMYKYVG